VPYPLPAAAATRYRSRMTNPTTITVPRAAAAKMIGVAPGTLRNWASASPARGPRPIKTGPTQQARTLYAVAELQKWQRNPAAYERRASRNRRGR